MSRVVRLVLRDRRMRALLLTAGPVAVERARRLAEQGRWRQMAVRHAESIEQGRFSDEWIDGARHWVVWSSDQPVVANPPAQGELRNLLALARPARRRDPEQLPTRRARRALAQDHRRHRGL
ncbi:MAG TPA: hypothetical protein VHF25_07200 [Nitriliruptorales bacterium]|nr:hypothetical protein [Nitriliruptorales bacterium]